MILFALPHKSKSDTGRTEKQFVLQRGGFLFLVSENIFVSGKNT